MPPIAAFFASVACVVLVFAAVCFRQAARVPYQDDWPAWTK